MGLPLNGVKFSTSNALAAVVKLIQCRERRAKKTMRCTHKFKLGIPESLLYQLFLPMRYTQIILKRLYKRCHPKPKKSITEYHIKANITIQLSNRHSQHAKDFVFSAIYFTGKDR